MGGGLAGAAAAFNISQLMQLVLLVGYTGWRDWRRRHHPHSTFAGVGKEAVQVGLTQAWGAGRGEGRAMEGPAPNPGGWGGEPSACDGCLRWSA